MWPALSADHVAVRNRIHKFHFDDDDNYFDFNSNIRPTPVWLWAQPLRSPRAAIIFFFFHYFIFSSRGKKNVRSRRLRAIFHFVIQFQLAGCATLAVYLDWYLLGMNAVVVVFFLLPRMHSHLSRQLRTTHVSYATYFMLPSRPPTYCLSI